MDDKICPSVTRKGTFQHYFVSGKKSYCNVHFIMLCSNALSLLSLNDFLVMFFSQESLSATRCTQRLRHKVGDRKHLSTLSVNRYSYVLNSDYNITYDTDLGY